MSGAPLRSVPTGPGVPTGGPSRFEHAHRSDRVEHGPVADLASDSLDTDLEPAAAALVGGTAVVVAASLLDFLR